MSYLTSRVTKTLYQRLIKAGYPAQFSISAKVSDTELYPTYADVLTFYFERFNVHATILYSNTSFMWAVRLDRLDSVTFRMLPEAKTWTAAVTNAITWLTSTEGKLWVK